MAKNVTLLGANYSDVPAVDLPQTGGGTATFTDVSDTTATTEDVLAGTYFYNAAGQKVEGELSGGGGRVIIRDTTDSHGGTIRTITSDEELYIDSLEVTENGTYTAPTGTAYDTVEVDVQASPTLQSKSATPTESAQTITADSGYDGLSSVSVGAISSTYVGTGITRRSSSDLTSSGATVTVPSGYYQSQATKSVVSGSATGPTSLSGTSATVSTGTNTLTLTKTGVTTTPTVSAGYVSSATASTASVSLTANVTTKSAATITPTTTNQTIASGTYLTGAQTISGDANLVAENIAEGVSIFGITGTHSGAMTYTATLTSSGTSSGGYVKHPGSTGTKYYTQGDTISFSEGDQLYAYVSYGQGNIIRINGETVAANYNSSPVTYTYTLPAKDITISFSLSFGASYCDITVPYQTLSISENGTYDVGDYDYADVNVSGGGGDTPEGKVYFIDYDGTVLHEYTAAQAQALSALPANPSHTGLTAQGWNWSLADIKSQLTNAGGDVTVGQMYITDDGKTRIYVNIENDSLHPYLGLGVNGSVVVDWGDNSQTNTITGSSLSTLVTVDHTYSTNGDYVISLSVSSGSFSITAGSVNQSQILQKSPNTSFTQGSTYLYKIKKIELGSNVTIGASAFLRCRNIETVSMPDGITALGSDAFSICQSLKCLVIPKNAVLTNNVSLLESCYNLLRVSIPKNCDQLPQNMLRDCYSLKSVTIPEGTSWSSYVFTNCYSLSSIIIPPGLESTSLTSHLFDGCRSLSSIILPEVITSGAEYAFYNCSSLSTVTIKYTGLFLGASRMFEGCANLKSIIKSGETNETGAGTYQFSDCRSLSEIPSIGIGSSNTYVLYNCNSLKTLKLRSVTTYIPNYAFNNCYSLESVDVPESLVQIGNNAFQNCYSLKSIDIPETVTSIGTNAFQSCYNLKTISFPDGITKMNNYVLSGCTRLSAFTIPDTVTSIGNYAFYQCYGLLKIAVPSGVTSIGSYAFSYCGSLSEIHFKAATPPTVSAANAFSNIPSGCVIYVPTGSLSAYTSATNYPSSATYTYVEE